MSDVATTIVSNASAISCTAGAARAAASGSNATPARGADDAQDFGGTLKAASARRANEKTTKVDKAAKADAAKPDDDEAKADTAATPDPGSGAPALMDLIQASMATATPATGTLDATQPLALPPSAATATKLSASAAAPPSAAATAAINNLVSTSTSDDDESALSALLGKQGLPSHQETKADMLPATMLSALTAALGSASSDASTAPVDSGTAFTQTALVTPRESTSVAQVLVSPSTLSQSSMPTSTLDATELPQRLGERLRWLIDGGVQEARLRLHPQDLGSIDIRVRIESGSASVWFAAEHPAARAALELALPQLRERFASDGLQLDSSAVSTQSRGGDAQGQSTSSALPDAGGFASAVNDELDEPVPSARMTAVHDGLIDRYA